MLPTSQTAHSAARGSAHELETARELDTARKLESALKPESAALECDISCQVHILKSQVADNLLRKPSPELIIEKFESKLLN